MDGVCKSFFSFLIIYLPYNILFYFALSDINHTVEVKTRNAPSYILWGLLSATALIVLPLVYISGIITTVCWFKKRSKTKQDKVPFYDYITMSQEQKVTTTVNNKCYMARNAPDLPKPIQWLLKWRRLSRKQTGFHEYSSEVIDA